MKRKLFKIIDGLFITAAAIIVLIGVLFSVARLFLPHIPEYRTKVQQWASTAIHQPVRITEMTALFSGFSPEIKFQGVEVLSKDQSQVLLKVNQLGVGLDLLQSLLKWRIVPGWIEVSGANLTLQQNAAGQFIFNGIAATAPDQENGSFKMEELIDWLLTQNKIYLEHINLTWQGKDGRIIPFRNIKLQFHRGLLSNKLVGTAYIEVPPRPTALRFVANFKGNPINHNAFTADLYARLRRVPLNFWLEKRIPHVTLNEGQADVQIWANWQSRQLQSLQSKFTVRDTHIQSTYLQHDLFLDHLGGNLQWQHQNQGWQFQSKFNLIANQETWPSTTITLQQISPTDGISSPQYHLQLNELDLGLMHRFLLNSTWLSDQQRQWLSQMQPSGLLQNINATASSMSLTKFTLPKEYNLAAELKGVSWQRWQNLPGIHHLSGNLQVSPGAGTFQVNTQNGIADFGPLFRTTLSVDEATGKITWEKNNSGWQLKGDEISLQNQLVKAQGNFNLLMPNNKSSPLINVVAGFNVNQLAPAMQYLPVKVLSPEIVHWLDRGIMSGQATSGNLLLSGPLRAFPFRKQEGRFVVNSAIQNLTLHYRDGWPDMQNVNGELTFNDAGMQMNAKEGKIFNSELQNINATIADFHTAILQVTGNVVGTLQDGLQFVQQSPLNDTIGKGLQGFVMQGPMNLALKLMIPLKQGDTQVQGNLTTAKADLKTPDLFNLHAQNLQGNLQFTQNSLTGKLTGIFLQKPFSVNMTTFKNAKSNTIQFDFGQNQMTVAQLQQQFELPKLNYITGNFTYRPVLQLFLGTQSPNKLTVTSDLRGVAINLPRPLTKLPTEAVPSTLQLNFSATTPLQWLINYNKRLSAALTYRKNARGKYTFSGGDISFGGKQANFVTSTGITLDGYFDNFNWADWQPILATLSPGAKTGEKPAPLLKNIDLKFGKLSIGNWSLTQTELQLVPGQQAWEVNIDSADMAGKLNVPYSFPRGLITANFDRLYLPENGSHSKINLTPNQIPELDLSSRDFRYGDKNIGAIVLQVTPRGNSLRIDRLRAFSPNLNFYASGNWQVSFNKNNLTSLSGKLTTTNLGNLLKEWNITESLVGGNGDANFDLSWEGTPIQPALNSLSGQVGLKFTDGRIINLSRTTEAELGIGRVLNLFSLQTLPRRLRLDFSDLTDAGFSFDVMQGDFNLTRGNATTNNAYLNGPVAKVALQGRIGLAAKDYNLSLQTTPCVTSNLPIVATVAGGPIAGAITWVASKILSSAVNQLTTYSYHVSGSWDNPNITKLQSSNYLKQGEMI